MSLESLVVFEPNFDNSNPYPYRSMNTEDFSINYEDGFKSKRELYLYLLSLKDKKDFTFSKVANLLIEGSSRYLHKAYAEDGFIFDKQTFLVAEDIPKIREVILANGFERDFVKNTTDEDYIKSNNSYHELFIKYSNNFIPLAAIVLLDTTDKTSGYDLKIMYVGRVDIGLEIKPKLLPLLKERKYLPTFRILRDIVMYPDGPDVRFRDEIIKPDAELAHESFYPWLAEHPKYKTIADFAHAYINGSSPVAVFYGPTGTGKTTFSRSIVKETNAVVLSTSDQNYATNPALFEAYKDMIEVARKNGDKRPYILLIEDVDSLLFSRISGNREMSRLLNETKGIAPNKDIKIIFSTNLTKLDQIDTALLRPGRCFATFDFRKLSLEEALNVRKHLKYEAIDLSYLVKDGTISLAEAIEEHEVKEVEAESVKNTPTSKTFHF